MDVSLSGTVYITNSSPKAETRKQIQVAKTAIDVAKVNKDTKFVLPHWTIDLLDIRPANRYRKLSINRKFVHIL